MVYYYYQKSARFSRFRSGNREGREARGVEKLLEKLREMGPKAILVVLAAVMLFLAIVAAVVIGVIETKKANDLRKKNEQIRYEQLQNEQAELSRLDGIYQETKQKAAAALPGFICLGDDLAAGRGDQRVNFELILQQAISEEVFSALSFETAVTEQYRSVVHSNAKRYSLPAANVVSYGESRASTATTLAMDGAYPILLTEKLTVPAGTDEVRTSFRTERGDYIRPLLGESKRSENVSLEKDDGTKISGTLTVRGSIDNPIYSFRRAEAGEPMEFPAGSRIVTEQSQENRNLFPIVWMGMNEGYHSTEELIEQCKLLLADKPLYEEGYYLVIGLLDRPDTEEAFEAAFGEHYLNARKFLNEQGLATLGLTAAEDEREQTAIAYGEVPLSLRHIYNAEITPFYLNANGYTAIGKEVYRKIDALGYFTAVRGVIADAMEQVRAGAN